MEPLYKRLHLENKWWNYEQMEPSIELAQRTSPTPDDFERAWAKRPFSRFLFSLACYYAGETQLARDHGGKCLDECGEFFFGTWRNTYKTEAGKVDPSWWKNNVEWISAFECALFWGSVLGKWEFLREVGMFPEPGGSLPIDYTDQDCDLYVSIGRFLSGTTTMELEHYLSIAERGPSIYCKNFVNVIRAALTRNAQQLSKKLIIFLEHYKAEEFPKESFLTKVSILGTFIVHWAAKEGVVVSVPPEFADHIVSL